MSRRHTSERPRPASAVRSAPEVPSVERFCEPNGTAQSDELRPLPDQLASQERERRRDVRPADRLDTRHDDEGPMVGEYLGTVTLPERSR